MLRSVILVLCMLPLVAQATESVKGVRLWAAPDNTRVVLDVSGSVEHAIFPLHNPERLVVDLKNTRLETPLAQPDSKDPLVNGIRSAYRNGSDLRVVLDLKQRVRPKSFLLAPNKAYGHRLVLDLFHTQTIREAKPRVARTLPSRKQGGRDLVIAIDAGHGGEDPGAIGYRGTREKDVVLAVAKRLQKRVASQPGMRPVLVRTGDYFLKLRDRIAKARQNEADLFISIHADAFKHKSARGSSVYVLSPDSTSTSETAQWLAESENASDLIGGVSLDDKDDLLKSVLLDLSQTATIISSLEIADEVLKNLKRVGRVHRRKVEQAGFVVLKSPDMPSMLVETAFISNPSEERNLKSRKHQDKLASAILKGVEAYFKKNPPPGTRFAANQYRIKPGDTLSAIARNFDVSQSALKRVNQLVSDTLIVGKTLRIPL